MTAHYIASPQGVRRMPLPAELERMMERVRELQAPARVTLPRAPWVTA
jgi:hypothetical protein